MGNGSSLQYRISAVFLFAPQSALTAPTASRVARKVSQGRVAGKAAVVTGVSRGGIGYFVAEALAVHAGMAVFLCGRSPEKLSSTADAIRREASRRGKPEPNLYLIHFDLNALDTVLAAASAILRHLEGDHGGRLQLLINNAGGVARGYEQTADGVEANVGRNYLAAHFFTEMLLPALRRAGTAAVEARRTGASAHHPRVVHVASLAHLYAQDVSAKLLLEDPGTGGSTDMVVRDEKARPVFKGRLLLPEALASYGRSKFMLISDARHLAVRERDQGVRALSLHPGSVATNIGLHGGLLRHAYFYGLYLLQYAPAQGAGVVVLAALSPDFDGPESPGAKGAYLHCTGTIWEPMAPKGGWREGRFEQELYDAASELCGQLVE